MKRKIIISFAMIVIIILVLLIILNPFKEKIDKKYLENPLYCESNFDCIENIPNCKVKDNLNCKNKYYKISDECFMEDMGFNPEDKCLCNLETNNCEIVRYKSNS